LLSNRKLTGRKRIAFDSNVHKIAISPDELENVKQLNCILQKFESDNIELKSEYLSFALESSLKKEFVIGNVSAKSVGLCPKHIYSFRIKLFYFILDDASQGMYIYLSKIEICFFTARILQNQRMLCCGECFHD
jgi:hypothetical protein